jgi:uncharacterized protein
MTATPPEIAMANGAGLQNRTALITGASGGIGLELTRLLAADGYHLVMVGRDRERLEDVMAQLQSDHKIAVRCEPRDLSESRPAFQLWADLTTAGIAIDVLVNNAGVGLYGLLEEQNAEALERMLQLNMAALTTLTRLALPGMRQRRWGRHTRDLPDSAGLQ